MNEKELTDLLASWENIRLIIRETAKQPATFDILMNIALNSIDTKSWRAAWVADKINDNCPELIIPYLDRIVKQLKKETHTGKKRQFLKLISLHEIRKKHFPFLTVYCLKCFTSALEPVGVKVNSLQILYNISQKEPGLKNELLSLIEYELEHDPSAGIVARGKRLATLLQKQIIESGI
jgi:hypothetical protein